MHPDIIIISILLVINLGLISLTIRARINHKPLNPNWIASIKDIGQLALAIGVLIQLIGLFAAFGDLERMKETLPFNVIIGGIKSTMYSTIEGLAVYLFSSATNIIFRLTER